MKRWPLILIWLGLWLVGFLLQIRMLWAILTNPERAWLIALSQDDSANVGLNGRLGQSISSRSAHARPRRWGCLLCKLLDALDPGHCDRAMTCQDQNLEK